MIVSDLRREENFQEYLRLISDPDYVEVTFDDQSGGVSAVHREHRFDKQVGPFGFRRGDYELNVITVLRSNGYRIVLEAENSREKIKCRDGLLNDMPMEIKSVEGNGAWSISSKLLEAEKQGAQVVVLYFPEPSLYSKDRVLDGIGKYVTNPRILASGTVSSCFVIVKNQLTGYYKRTTTHLTEWL